MTTRSFAKRIGKLETKMDVPEFERGSTKIAWECLSEREKKLFDRLDELRKEYGDGFGAIPKEVLAENRDVLDKGIDIMLRRAFDLLLSIVSSFWGEDKFYESIFAVRFHAFLVSTLSIVEMRRREDAFYQQVQEKYGDDWPDDVGEPDLAGVGERDFDKALSSLIRSSFKEENSKDGTG